MNDPWITCLGEGFITLEVDGEKLRYNPDTGEIFFLTAYKNGAPDARALVYRTGRGVVKVKVDGASHRMMDVIYANLHGSRIRGYQGYPKNGDFADLRAENIIMVRNRESLFGQELP